MKTSKKTTVKKVDISKITEYEIELKKLVNEKLPEMAFKKVVTMPNVTLQGDFLYIILGASKNKIESDKPTRPQQVSLSLFIGNKIQSSLRPSAMGRDWGNFLWFDGRLRKVPFRASKKMDIETVKKQVSTFIDNWIKTLKENKNKLGHKDIVNYDLLFSEYDKINNKQISMKTSKKITVKKITAKKITAKKTTVKKITATKTGKKIIKKTDVKPSVITSKKRARMSSRQKIESGKGYLIVIGVVELMGKTISKDLNKTQKKAIANKVNSIRNGIFDNPQSENLKELGKRIMSNSQRVYTSVINGNKTKEIETIFLKAYKDIKPKSKAKALPKKLIGINL